MTSDLFESFAPFYDSTLASSWDWTLRHEGYVTTWQPLFWDFISRKDGEPTIATKTINGSITPQIARRIMLDDNDVKVLFVEGRPNMDNLTQYAMVISASSCGIYIRNLGWLCYPMQGVPLRDHPLAKTGTWRMREDGEWVKRCPVCHEEKTTEGYYRKPRTRAVPGRDPYRTRCKSCTTT